MEQLNHVLEMLNKLSMGEAIGSAALGAEFIMRIMKTEKPRSIAHTVSDILKGVANVMAKAADILDKVLPQRVEAPKGE
jgi:glycerol-3-phosphate acyltransferase PlsY